jgi:type 1 glutamine amidotransferase
MKIQRLFLALAILTSAAAAQQPKLVLIAGKPSHPARMHEFRAGSMLLEKCLKDNAPGLIVDRHEIGWVKDEATFNDATAVVIYADGGGGHPAVQGEHLKTLGALMAKGVGFGCMHYGVEVVPAQAGKEFQSWIGGHYENSFSCNPIWEPSFESFPSHPITSGVKPFKIADEWYFQMRFRPAFKDGIEPATDGKETFTPILVSKPSDATRGGPYVYPKGPYPHIQAEAGQPEAMMWAVERADGGRGFGFTGGHFHDNWGNDNFRKVILNALLWTAKAEVPADGVNSTVTAADLDANLDLKPVKKPKVEDKAKAPAAKAAMAPTPFLRRYLAAE